MSYWAKPGLDRHQVLLFYPTLDKFLGDGHEVRMLDKVLRAQKWSEWGMETVHPRGQPPIPPWVMAGVILYGLMRRIRSSRALEYACGNNLDFIWLTEGRQIDHSTLCIFRTKFKKELKLLFKSLARLALEMGLVQLAELAFDGTRVKANASRFHTWTAERVEKALAELEPHIEQMLREAEAADAAEATLLDESKPRLSPELAEAKQRQEELRQVLEKLQQADAARKQDGIKTPAQLPKADTTSSIMPNKEGGYAANYTPAAMTDGAAKYIVDCDVISGPNEHTELLPSVKRTAETFEQKIGSVAADKAFGTGQNLQEMEKQEVQFYTPVESPSPQAGNPARREDPRQPVPEAEWPKLPRNDKKKLAKSCFVYDQEKDLCYCPMGKELRYRQSKKSGRSQGQVSLRIYACQGCTGCALSNDCREAKAQRGRTVTRDGYEPLRDKMHAKMQSAESKKIYGRRMHIGETPFAIIKGILEVRRFLLRGLEKVRTEWMWVCTAYNLRILIAALAALRAEGKQMPPSLRG